MTITAAKDILMKNDIWKNVEQLHYHDENRDWRVEGGIPGGRGEIGFSKWRSGTKYVFLSMNYEFFYLNFGIYFVHTENENLSIIKK